MKRDIDKGGVTVMLRTGNLHGQGSSNDIKKKTFKFISVPISFPLLMNPTWAQLLSFFFWAKPSFFLDDAPVKNLAQAHASHCVGHDIDRLKPPSPVRSWAVASLLPRAAGHLLPPGLPYTRMARGGRTRHTASRAQLLFFWAYELSYYQYGSFLSGINIPNWRGPLSLSGPPRCFIAPSHQQ